MGDLAVEAVSVGPFQVNCYLLHDGDEAVVVDPGAEAETILDRVDGTGATVEAIFLTHGHMDHVTAVADVREATGAPVWLHPDDRPIYDQAPDHAARFMGTEIEAPPEPGHDLEPGAWSAGPVEGEILHTPGHTPGGVTLHLADERLALVGDVLFAGGIGRTDLGGDRATLMASIEEVLMELPDETRVLPGHGPETTIGRERQVNPFLRGRV